MKVSQFFCALVAALGVSAKTYDVYRQPPQSQQRQHMLLAAGAADDASYKTPASLRGGAWLAASDQLGTATGTIIVPQARMPTVGPTGNNGAGLYMASFWVGLGCPDSADAPVLRTGIDIFWDGGIESYNAWFQWYPNPATTFDVSTGNFSVRPGDKIKLSVVDTGGNSGIVAVKNLYTGGEVGFHFATDQSHGQLCGNGAAWVVEDFALSGLPNIPVALANFTTVTFQDAYATTTRKHSRTVSATKAKVFDIYDEQQGGQLTSCSVSGRRDVVCSRVLGGR